MYDFMFAGNATLGDLTVESSGMMRTSWIISLRNATKPGACTISLPLL